MTRHLAANGITFLIVGLVLALGLLNWGQTQYSGPGPLSEAICFEVAPGSNMNRVSEQLADRGAISNATIFRIGSNYQERTNLLKAGSFLIEPATPMEEILSTITSSGRSTCGSELLYRIGVNSVRMQVREFDAATSRYVEAAVFDPTDGAAPQEVADLLARPDTRIRLAVAEGATSWQITQALNAAEFLEGQITSVPSEGSLAPNSYEVRQGTSVVEVVEQMETAQIAALEEAWEARDPDLPIASPQELLTLASIIEKETGVADERPLVGSVFINRLRQGMKLQTDPTVIYGITKGEGVLGRGLRRSELDRETPYNTYVIDGLPPTPIANPGRAAILAAAQPDESPYIFFVADGTGGHAFAETLDEHNRNVAEWRKIEAERQQQSE